MLSDDYYQKKFDLYGALWKFCSEYHSGQSSVGYRILSRLSKAKYNPGLSLQNGLFESMEQAEIYFWLVNNYTDKV